MKFIAIVLFVAAAICLYIVAVISKKIKDGQQQIADGYRQVSNGQSRLADAKAKINAGEREYAKYQNLSNKLDSPAFFGFTTTFGLLGRAANKFVIKPKLQDGRARLDDGINKYNEGMRKVEDGKRRIAIGEQQLAEGEKKRSMFLILAVIFGFAGLIVALL